MKVVSFICAFALSVLAFADTVTNQYITIDQDGNISHSNVVASISQIALTAARAEVAAQAAESAAQAAATATNTLKAIVSDLGTRELVIYQQGYTTAFDSTVFLSPDAKVCVYKMNVCVAQNTAGNLMAHDLYYACTEKASSIIPIINYSDSVQTDVTTWGNVSSQEGPFDADPFTDEVSGQVYPYGYRVRVWTPISSSGFFRIVLDGGDPLGDGYTFNIVGGVTGGVTQEIVWDGYRIGVSGGIITSVEAIPDED